MSDWQRVNSLVVSIIFRVVSCRLFAFSLHAYVQILGRSEAEHGGNRLRVARVKPSAFRHICARAAARHRRRCLVGVAYLWTLCGGCGC